MREIKFRAWDGKSLSYGGFNIHATGKASIGFPTFNCSEDELVVMQFTGLKDKNGKEVYEGDIVKSTRYIGGHYLDTLSDLVTVEFYNFKWVIQPVKGRLHMPNNLSELESDCEVIGNIYQNPELLNET